MSVINNLGELKSGHHAGLDLKEVWANGEKVWPTARQFMIAGPVKLRLGWGYNWDVDMPVMGDLSMLSDDSYSYPRDNDYVTFNVPVTCDRRTLDRRDEVQEPGTILQYRVKPYLDRSIGDNLLDEPPYYTFTEVT